MVTATADRASPAASRRGVPLPRLRGVLPELLPLALLLICALIFHGPELFGGAVFSESDTRLFYYPLTDWFAEQLRGGRLPLWIPTMFAGYPLLADGEIGPLYPLNLLVLPWLPVGPAFVLLRAVHTALAAGLMYGLTRVLGASRLGGFIGGLVFSLGSFLVGQLQHENMVRSTVWLPGILLLFELALRARGWARQRRLVGAGLLLGTAALGLHIQALAMVLLALGIYVVHRLLVGPTVGPWRERLALLAWGPGLIALVALGLSAAQWLPLFEVGRTSYRGPGLTYALATTWTLAPFNLPALLFPYFFRDPNGLWWSLWAPWETLPYVGVAPLALGILGLFARRRAATYFGLLALLGLWIALSHYAPFNLHELLWRLPGFSSLRAPGRFSFLFVFGAAGLAAFGIDVVRHGTWEAGRGRIGLTSLFPLPPPLLFRALGILCLAAAVLLPPTFLFMQQRLRADPGWGQQVAELRYLGLRHQNPDLEPYQVYDGLVYSLSPLAPKTALSLGLLAAVGVLLLARWRWRERAARIALALAALSTLDLLVFALDYHPLQSRADLAGLPPAGEALARESSGEHVFAEPVLSELEPNRLTLGRIRDLNGYSSLQSERHYEYLAGVDRADNALLDAWDGRYFVVPARRTDVAIPPGTGTAYRPYELLVSGGPGNPTGRELFRVEPFQTGEVRVLAALANAIAIPQGETVAELTLSDAAGRSVTLPLRAGIELSEHAIDRPDVAPITAHARARVVAGLPDQAPTGQPFTSNIYYSSFPLSPPLAVETVGVRYVAADGYLRLWGLGLVDPSDGRVRSLFSDDRAKYAHPPLYRDERVVIYRNTAAFGRAFVVPEALARRGRTEETAIARMAIRPFDPRRQAVLEEGPFDDVPLAAAAQPDAGSDAPPPAATVVDRSPEDLLVTATGPGVLVLTDAYHRGWRAYLADGREVPVYLANYVARAVGLPPGEQTVRFVFDPLSWRLGRAISFAALAFALAVLSSRLWARNH